ncbi:MAG TPA: GNAT family N-acetyltransferase [Burkholderiales bacterium]|nr:GNAT family N-acetyltransferase [Burkholderiales bacterium]
MNTSLRLIPLDIASIAAILDDLDQFQERLGVSAETNRSLIVEVARQTGAMLQVSGVQAPWCGYLVVNDATRMFIGTCGFKGKPDGDGAVEIAYFTFPESEHRGYATQMARALTDVARKSGAVRRLIAHTRPEKGASTRVLEKIGMTLHGEITDPEDGRVWRWEMTL